VQISQSTL